MFFFGFTARFRDRSKCREKDPGTISRIFDALLLTLSSEVREKKDEADPSNQAGGEVAFQVRFLFLAWLVIALWSFQVGVFFSAAQKGVWRGGETSFGFVLLSFFSVRTKHARLWFFVRCVLCGHDCAAGVSGLKIERLHCASVSLLSTLPLPRFSIPDFFFRSGLRHYVSPFSSGFKTPFWGRFSSGSICVYLSPRTCSFSFWVFHGEMSYFRYLLSSLVCKPR